MACITKKRYRDKKTGEKRVSMVIDFYDQDGKRRLETLPQGTTKKKARDRLREIEELVGKGNFLPSKKIPLFSKVAKDWIEYKKPNLRETTWEVCEGHVRNHFHELNSIKITRITTATIEKWIAARQAQDMHILTLRKIMVTLGQIFSYAVRHRYIDYNPLREAERPRGQGKENETHKTIIILQPEQITALLGNVEILSTSHKPISPNRLKILNNTKKKYRMLFMLAIFSGARQGELLGLKWNDVDWENSQIHIQRTYNNGRFFATKTKASNRRIDLGPAVMTELKKWNLACPNSDLNLVFPNSAGQPIDHHNMVRRCFLPTLKAAELPRMRFHDIRHTYASLLIEQGENIKYIQSQLGHSSPTVTWNVYAHLMKPVNQEAACKLEKTIFGENGDFLETYKKGVTVKIP